MTDDNRDFTFAFYQDADKFNINALELNLHVYQKM